MGKQTKQLAMQMSSPDSPNDSSQATAADLDKAITLLLTLPAREPEDDAARRLIKAVFVEAIRDVPAAWLGRALQQVARGGHGHGFRPSPPELRIYIDRLMKGERPRPAMIEDSPLVGGEFPASIEDIDKQLDRLIAAMTKPKGFDVDDQRPEYYRAVRGIKLSVLVEAVDRLLDGRIARKVLSVPRVNEFGQAVREVRDELSAEKERVAKAGRTYYRFKTPKSEVLARNVTRQYGRDAVDADVLPRGSIWIPGSLTDHPEIGTIYAPDPEWQPPQPA